MTSNSCMPPKRNCFSCLVVTVMLANLATSALAADGPSSIFLRTYGSPIADDAHRAATITTAELDEALEDVAPPYEPNFARNLLIDVFDRLFNFKAEFLEAVKEEIVGMEVREDNGWEFKILDVVWANLDGNPLSVDILRFGDPAVVVVGDIDIDVRVRVRVTVFGQIRLGRCSGTVFVNNLGLELTINIDPFAIIKSRPVVGDYGAQHFSCTKIAGLFEWFAKSHLQGLMQKAIERVDDKFTDDADSLVGLADLTGAVEATDIVPLKISDTLSNSVAALLGTVADNDGPGVVVTATFEEFSESNSESITIEAPSPVITVKGEQYTVITYDHPPDTVTSWQAVDASPKFMKIEGAASTVPKVFIGGNQPRSPIPASGSFSVDDVISRWYAIGAYSDEIETIWSKPKYLYVECVRVSIRTICFQ